MADKKEKLFSDFSPVSTEQWMEKVTADLKGADSVSYTHLRAHET